MLGGLELGALLNQLLLAFQYRGRVPNFLS
jgi:hypothetical protein